MSEETTPPRPEWKLPPPPVEKCPLCGGEIVAEAYIKTENGESGWVLQWVCYNWEPGACPDDQWSVPIEWPFEDDASVDEFDLAALGFTVTEEWFDELAN